MNQDKYFHQQGIKKVKGNCLCDAIKDFSQALDKRIKIDFVEIAK